MWLRLAVDCQWFCSIMASRRDDLNDDEKVSVVLDLLLAGYETTSGLLALIVYFLARSPSALQELKEEHRPVKRYKKDGELLNLEDYKQMEFTSNSRHRHYHCLDIQQLLEMKPRTNGVPRAQRSKSFPGEGPNWVLIASGALLSTLLIRLGYRLKQLHDTKQQDKGRRDSKGNGSQVGRSYYSRKAVCFGW